jgi:hypothetical protein
MPTPTHPARRRREEGPRRGEVLTRAAREVGRAGHYAPETFGPRVAAVAGAASASATSTAARSFIRRFSNAEPEAST